VTTNKCFAVNCDIKQINNQHVRKEYKHINVAAGCFSSTFFALCAFNKQQQHTVTHPSTHMM